MAHNSLENYYQTIFNLVTHYHYSISDIEGLYPYELDIYSGLLKQHLSQIEEQQRLGL